MTARRIVPLILAGGAGTRLWPVSRDAMPKQFLPLVGEKSTYQQALMRVSGDLFGPPIVMTSDAFRFFARRQAEEIGVDATVVLEPMRRDSGPAIAAGAAFARRRDPDAIVLAIGGAHPTPPPAPFSPRAPRPRRRDRDAIVLAIAADHVILDTDLFHDACRAGRDAAAQGQIVTFGIR